MKKETIISCIIEPGARVPEYQTKGSAGADLFAFLSVAVILKPGERALVGTGVRIEIPYNCDGQIRPRSGWALDKGITCLNAPGTIDSDYRGEVKVLLINLGSEPVEICNGDRVAQLVIARHRTCQFKIAEKLSSSQRDKNGFGSTGI